MTASWPATMPRASASGVAWGSAASVARRSTSGPAERGALDLRGDEDLGERRQPVRQLEVAEVAGVRDEERDAGRGRRERARHLIDPPAAPARRARASRRRAAAAWAAPGRPA
jgi:hypothetical protein